MEKKKISKKPTKVPKPEVNSIYTWRLCSFYGYVKAQNMTEAICKAVKSHYGKKSKETLIRFDMLVGKGKT